MVSDCVEIVILAETGLREFSFSAGRALGCMGNVAGRVAAAGLPLGGLRLCCVGRKRSWAPALHG